jgi:hypothetical protein
MITSPAAASAAAPQKYGDALAVGSRLHELEIRSLLGTGGFGIVYLAWDHALEREVALKEYMPGAFASRGSGGEVVLRLPAESETFAIGLSSFVNEARLLARFEHPALVKVHRFWEGNGTAYMVMPYYRGRTLRQMRNALGQAADESACRRLIDPLLSALELLHRDDIFHRDIAPDNILVDEHGAPVLLDFGAARKVIANSKPLTTILKPSFAPLEQYGDDLAMNQGPWTDLYALGATVHYLLVGQPPPPSAKRALHDELQPLSTRGLPGHSARFLRAIDWTLGLRPHERPQDVAALRAALDGGAAAPAPRLRVVSTRDIAERPAQPDIEQDGPVPTTLVMQTHAPTQPIGVQDASLRRAVAEWLWLLRYCGLALLALGLGRAIGSMELFEGTVLVRRQLNAAHLVRFMGEAGALVIIALASVRATAQLRQRDTAAWQHRLVAPLALLVATPCAYAALLPVARPFMSEAVRGFYNWSFVLGTFAAAGWLGNLLFVHADTLMVWPRRSTGIDPGSASRTGS